MSVTSRELVHQTLNFNSPARVPRHLTDLPIVSRAKLKAIVEEFPLDVAGVDGHQREKGPGHGGMYAAGGYTDDWGATFANLIEGIHGEVKDPLIQDWTRDVPKVHIPREWLTIDRDAINRDCADSTLFCNSSACPRPYEQLQFLRGTPELLMDLMDPPPAMRDFMRRMHAFYTECLAAWAKTDVDCLCFMDDWGSQTALFIPPRVWRDIFKPMYRDYVQIAHAANKKILMHSDGYTLEIIPDLIEIGVDAINCQIFCMGVERLAPFAGKITFWGELDRQHLLSVDGTLEQIDAAVRSVYRTLWRNGGCIAQGEFGDTTRPEQIRQMYRSWLAVHDEAQRRKA
jgi:hypothetical protein